MHSKEEYNRKLLFSIVTAHISTRQFCLLGALFSKFASRQRPFELTNQLSQEPQRTIIFPLVTECKVDRGRHLYKDACCLQKRIEQQSDHHLSPLAASWPHLAHNFTTASQTTTFPMHAIPPIHSASSMHDTRCPAPASFGI